MYSIAGAKKIRAITQSYLRKNDGFFLVYDVSNRASFDNCMNWLSDIRTCCQRENPSIILIGNKIDQDKNRVVSTAEGTSLAQTFGNVTFAETSARTGVGIRAAFKNLLCGLAKRSSSKIIHFKVESFDSSGSTTIFKCETTIIDGNGQRRSVPSEKRYSSILEQHRIVGKGLSFPPKKYCGSMKKCFVERRKNQLNAYFRKLLKRYSNLQTNVAFIEWCFADTTSSCACLKIFR